MSDVAPWDVDLGTGWDAKPTQEQPPTRFADAYAELQKIAAALKPAPGKIIDIDELEPAIRRANILARFCNSRIEAVRTLVEEQGSGLSDPS